MKIYKRDIELIRFILDRWDDVSVCDHAFHSQTDHCHTEYSEAEELIRRMYEDLETRDEG